MRKRNAKTGMWHTAVLLKLGTGFIAALMLTMPAAVLISWRHLPTCPAIPLKITEES